MQTEKILANISMISNRHPIIIKIMLNVGIPNPDPINERRIAITPNTSAPYPGDDIPNIKAKMPSINNRDVITGFEISLRNWILNDGEYLSCSASFVCNVTFPADVVTIAPSISSRS